MKATLDVNKRHHSPLMAEESEIKKANKRRLALKTLETYLEFYI